MVGISISTIPACYPATEMAEWAEACPYVNFVSFILLWFGLVFFAIRFLKLEVDGRKYQAETSYIVATVGALIAGAGVVLGVGLQLPGADDAMKAAGTELIVWCGIAFAGLL